MISSRMAVMGMLITGLSVAARADKVADEPMEDFAAAVHDATGDHARPWVMSKFVTFKLGARCWAKLPDKNAGAVHAATFFTRDIMEWAKGITGDDWSAIESQNNNDREANKALIEPMMDAFKARFSMTVSVEGNDCDARQSSLWIGYWTQLGTALKNYPPTAKKISITLNVTAKAKDVTAEVSPDGSTFTFTAPRDIEVTGWSDKLDKPFRRIVAGLPDELSFMSYEYTSRYWTSWVLTKLTTFKVGKKCLARLPDRDEGVLHAASFYSRDIGEYAMLVGAEDWDRIEQQSANEPAFNRELVAKDMDEFARRFHVTVSVDGDDCDAKQSSLWIRYWTQIATTLKNYPPRAAKVAITLNVTAKAKAVTVTAGKDGASFAIVAPRDLDPGADGTDKIDAAFRRVARKPSR